MGTGEAVTFLSEIRPEDFNAPRNLWEKVFDDGAKERFINNVSGRMSTVTEDLASRLEKATGIKGYDGISGLSFNGTHNGMAKDDKLHAANGMNGINFSGCDSNGAPMPGTHQQAVAAH